MRQVSTSSIPLMGLGLLIGLGFIGCASTVAMAAQSLSTLRESCLCDCGGDEVYVDPTIGRPNFVNCNKMNHKLCKDLSGNLAELTCDGTTVVQRPIKTPGVPQRPVIPILPTLPAQ